MSEMPGPEVAVKARAPFHMAPITMPIAASSSSAWMKAKFLRPRLRIDPQLRSPNILNASMSEVDGVIGYQAATVAPANTQPSAAAVLPSIMMLPAVWSSCCTCSGSGQVKFALRIVVAELDRLHVALDQLRLLGVGLGQQLADARQVQIEERGEHPGIADVLHQDARAHAVEVLVAQLRERHAEHRDVLALQQRRARPGGVVNQIAARGDLLDIACVGLGVHGDHDVDAARTRAT